MYVECAYGFRYVELNHRQGSNLENPDYDPWSVRQTTVYQQYNSSMDRMTFVLISPSKKTKKMLGLAVQRCLEYKRSLNAFDLHLIIISTLHGNWRLYVRSLERLLMSQVSNEQCCCLRATTKTCLVRKRYINTSQKRRRTMDTLDGHFHKIH